MERKKQAAGVIFSFNCCIGVQEIEEHSSLARQTGPDGHPAQRAKDLEEGGNRAHRCQKIPSKLNQQGVGAGRSGLKDLVIQTG